MPTIAGVVPRITIAWNTPAIAAKTVMRTSRVAGNRATLAMPRRRTIGWRIQRGTLIHGRPLVCSWFN